MLIPNIIEAKFNEIQSMCQTLEQNNNKKVIFVLNEETLYILETINDMYNLDYVTHPDYMEENGEVEKKLFQRRILIDNTLKNGTIEILE